MADRTDDPVPRVAQSRMEEKRMAASDDLTKLAARAKVAEDHVAAARDKAKAELAQDVSAAQADAQASAEGLRQLAQANDGMVSSWWDDTQRSWNRHMAAIRDDVHAKKAEHDLDRAERRADVAEGDAAFAMDFAYAAIEEAEYAVLDAGLARLEADELAAKAS
jgi:hypothetical protein